MKQRQLLGSLLLLLVAVIWGTAFAFQRMGTGEDNEVKVLDLSTLQLPQILYSSGRDVSNEV